MGVLLAAVVDRPLDLDAHLRLVQGAGTGAVASFVGRIRNHDPEALGEVTAIDYTHHPDAGAILARLASDVLVELDPDGHADVAVSHRVGRLGVGDLALVACVGTAHRALAFAVCEALVERVKRDLPIWKQQFEADGREVWSQLALPPTTPGDAG